MTNEREFVKTITAFSGIAGRRIDFVMRKIGIDALSGVLRRSPVDTGRFRASWRYSVDTVDSSVEQAPAKGAKASIQKGASPSAAEITSAIAANRAVTRASVIHITNSLSYAPDLEDGKSPQAPNGVVKPTFVAIESGIAAAVAASKRAVPDA